MVNDTMLGKNYKAVEIIRGRVERDISRYMNKKDIKIKDRGRLNFAEISFESQKGRPFTSMKVPSRFELERHYNSLLSGKISDEHLKKKTIRYAEIMVQPTTYCNLKLTSHKQTIAELKVICCLPEFGQVFANWWIGKQIDSNNFRPLVNSFKSAMKKFRVSNVLIERPPLKPVRVGGIRTRFSFA